MIFTSASLFVVFMFVHYVVIASVRLNNQLGVKYVVFASATMKETLVCCFEMCCSSFNSSCNSWIVPVVIVKILDLNILTCISIFSDSSKGDQQRSSIVEAVIKSPHKVFNVNATIKPRLKSQSLSGTLLDNINYTTAKLN